MMHVILEVMNNCAYGYENFWINCLLFTAHAMMDFSELIAAESIE
jgi:hypothetical protein